MHCCVMYCCVKLCQFGCKPAPRPHQCQPCAWRRQPRPPGCGLSSQTRRSLPRRPPPRPEHWLRYARCRCPCPCMPVLALVPPPLLPLPPRHPRPRPLGAPLLVPLPRLLLAACEGGVAGSSAGCGSCAGSLLPLPAEAASPSATAAASSVWGSATAAPSPAVAPATAALSSAAASGMGLCYAAAAEPSAPEACPVLAAPPAPP